MAEVRILAFWKYKNIFSGQIVTVERVIGDTVEYRRSTPMPGFYGSRQFCFQKPIHVFQKCYRFYEDPCQSPTPASSPVSILQEAI